MQSCRLGSDAKGTILPEYLGTLELRNMGSMTDLGAGAMIIVLANIESRSLVLY